MLQQQIHQPAIRQREKAALALFAAGAATAAAAAAAGEGIRTTAAAGALGAARAAGPPAARRGGDDLFRRGHGVVVEPERGADVVLWLRLRVRIRVCCCGCGEEAAAWAGGLVGGGGEEFEVLLGGRGDLVGVHFGEGHARSFVGDCGGGGAGVGLGAEHWGGHFVHFLSFSAYVLFCFLVVLAGVGGR